MKQDFKIQAYKDLSGGLNLNDYSTEIDDKQCLKSENWSAKGNKLVTAEKYNINNTIINCKGFLRDGENIYYIQGGALYKNGVSLINNGVYTIQFSSDPSNKIIGFNFNGTYYNFKPTSYSNLTTLITSMVGGGYTVVFDGVNKYTITKATGSFTISIETTRLKTIQITSWLTENKADITIDGVTKTISGFVADDYSGIFSFLSAQYPSYLWENISTGKFRFARTDGALISLTISNGTSYKYKIEGTGTAYTNQFSANVGGDPGSQRIKTDFLTVTIDGIEYRYTTPVTKDFNPHTYTGPSGGLEDNTYHYPYTFVANYIYSNMSGYTKTLLGGGLYGFIFNKADYSQSTWTNSYGDIRYIKNIAGDTILGSYIQTNYPALGESTGIFISTYSVNTSQINLDGYGYSFTTTVLSTGSQINSSVYYRILKTEYGFLCSPIFQNRSTIFIYESSPGVYTSTLIGFSEGNGVCSTLYKGKLLMGIRNTDGSGNYTGGSNLRYSKTGKTGYENNITIFTGYSAGSQKLNSNKPGYITGFYEGENGLYVFKNNEVWLTNSEEDTIKTDENTGTSTSTFNFIFTKTTNTGAYSQECITSNGQEIFYYDGVNKSIRRLSYEQNMQTLRDTAISKDVDILLKSIPDNPIGYKQLHSLNFKYPNLEFNYCSDNNYQVVVGGFNDEKIVLPNSILVYNVETGSYFTRTNYSSYLQSPISIINGEGLNMSGEVFNWTGNATSGTWESKLYTITGLDSYYKRFSWVDIIGTITPDSGQTKSITLSILVGGVIIETRTISSTTNIKQFRERIDMYADGQDIQFKITHTGNGKVEISDLYLLYKPLSGYHSSYF